MFFTPQFAPSDRLHILYPEKRTSNTNYLGTQIPAVLPVHGIYYCVVPLQRFASLPPPEQQIENPDPPQFNEFSSSMNSRPPTVQSNPTPTSTSSSSSQPCPIDTSNLGTGLSARYSLAPTLVQEAGLACFDLLNWLALFCADARYARSEIQPGVAIEQLWEFGRSLIFAMCLYRYLLSNGVGVLPIFNFLLS
jgi:hypothetical protein